MNQTQDAPDEVSRLRENLPIGMVGWVVGIDAEGNPLVDFPGNAAGPLPALSTLAIDANALQAAAAARQGAVLFFQDRDGGHPILLGLVQKPSSTPLLDTLLNAPAPREEAEATLDGKRVVLEGKDEVVLRCGQASITLRRNGKVLIRGIQVETQASGTNRIKGGSVQIN